MSVVLGAIADDFTGATDLANNLVRSGMRCVQVIDVPDDDLVPDDSDAVVIALKSRSCPSDEAVADSLKALNWLQRRAVRQVFFKYCSTFDSTDEGNIGPVSDALLEALGASQTVMVPAFPVNRRTVYQGHLFVGDRLLNESGMEHHPLNPMRDADLVRVLSKQTPFSVGLVPHEIIVEGADAVGQHFVELAHQGVRHLICDTIDESDLEVLARSAVQFALVTGGSGIGQALPAEYRRMGWLKHLNAADRMAPANGASLVLSGSCSRATLRQIEHFLKHRPGFALDPLRLAEGDEQLQQAVAFAREHLRDTDGRQDPVMIYASAGPDSVKAAQQSLGADVAGRLVEQALGKLARILIDEGVGRLIVAGGESAGAVVSALGIRLLRIGRQIDPGVPWTQAELPRKSGPLSLALKSGNFGGVDFFIRAFRELA